MPTSRKRPSRRRSPSRGRRKPSPRRRSPSRRRTPTARSRRSPSRRYRAQAKTTVYLVGAAQNWAEGQYVPKKHDGLDVVIVDPADGVKGFTHVKKEAKDTTFADGAYVISYTVGARQMTFRQNYIEFAHSAFGFEDLNEFIANFSDIKTACELRKQIMEPIFGADGLTVCNAPTIGTTEANELINKCVQQLVTKPDSRMLSQVYADTARQAGELVNALVYGSKKARGETLFDDFRTEHAEVRASYESKGFRIPGLIKNVTEGNCSQ